MSNDASDNSYLHFEDLEETSSSNTTIEDTNTEKINLSPKDFANLARKANGERVNFNAGILDAQSDEAKTHLKSKEEELNSLLDEESQKIGLTSPYLKIIVGIVLTSAVVIALVLLRGGWLRIINLSQNSDTTKTKLSVDPQKQEIDRLKAELALIEQSKKPIKPAPEPELEPKAEYKLEPKPEPEPAPKPEPIDPYKQWELLSQLGTLGSSDIEIENTTSAKISRLARDRPVPSSSSVSIKNRINNEEIQPNNLKASRTENRIASVSLDDDLGITNTVVNSRYDRLLARESNRSQATSDNFYNQNSAKLQSKFSPDAQRIILSGLGVSSSSLERANRHTDTVNRQSSQIYFLNPHRSNIKQIAIASSIKGILATSIVWTDNSNPEDTRGNITLTEPLNYENGDIALPSGSSIIVEVADFDRAGFVNLRAIAISAKNAKGEVIQQEIPEDSLLIRGEDNRPLKFETENSDDGDSGVDRLLGNIVKEGSRRLPIPRQVSSSVSKAILNGSRSRSNTGKFYFVEARTPVSVYVNNSITIGQ